MTVVQITREAPDTLCLRASVGGTPELGYYLVYRAEDPSAIVTMLREVLEEAERELPRQARGGQG